GSVPVFCSGKLTLTVSSGSTPPFAGPQLSWVTAAGGEATTIGPQQVEVTSETSSILHPPPVVDVALLNAARHRSLISWPRALAGKLTLGVMNPFDPAMLAPVQAARPPMGLPLVKLIVPLYPPETKFPPTNRMSVNAQPLMLISRTPPSALACRLKLFLKVSCALTGGTARVGESSRLSEADPELPVKAPLGAETK